MSINYQVAIHHHADWIWDQLHNGAPEEVNQCNPQLCLDVANALEDAELSVDEHRYNSAICDIIFAARLVFGFYSETYLQFVRFYS